MPTSGQTLENPITGERIVLRNTAHETGGRSLVIDQYFKPHTDTFAGHVQLNQEERFEILAGTATYRLNSVENTARAGEVIVVPYVVITSPRHWGRTAKSNLCNPYSDLHSESHDPHTWEDWPLAWIHRSLFSREGQRTRMRKMRRIDNWLESRTANLRGA